MSTVPTPQGPVPPVVPALDPDQPGGDDPDLTPTPEPEPDPDENPDEQLPRDS